MKYKRILIATLLLIGSMTACTEKEIPAEKLPPETKAAEQGIPDETDPPETVPDDTDETLPDETEPEEITIVLGEEMPDDTEPAETEPAVTTPPETEPADTDDGVIRMLVPDEYGQVWEALAKAEWYGLPYEEAVEKGITETMAPTVELEAVPEEVMDVPASDASFAPADEAPGKIYTAEEAFSRTNTQLAEIDEGDVVKTDGEYIYLLKDASELVILSAEGKDTAVLSRIGLTENAEYCGVALAGGGLNQKITVNRTANELYIEGDSLAVICSESKWKNGSYERRTVADFYDVSDPAAPAYVTTLGQDGIYSTSRMTDGTLWLITSHSLSIDDIADPLDLESYIPGLFRKEIQTLIDPGCIVYPEVIETKVYTVITSSDMKSGTRQQSKAVLGIQSDRIYMNSASIYLADLIYYNEESEPRTEGVYTVVDHTSGTRTGLMRLDITDGIRTAAYAELPGELLNQFSMDEYNGHLRVVTTVDERSRTTFTDESWGFVNTRYNPDRRANALYILDRDLNITGKIEDIAPDEQVKSVRFMGDTGYFVTFRQVDPLFSVDLSDPESPEILGELKIPGFSQYLHPWDDGLLLGLGQDADEVTGRTTGLKLSMFNIGNPRDVSEQDKLKLAYQWSEALYNHRAVLASRSRNLIGFPADNGYAVYGYDPESGFFERAYIEMDGYWSSFSRGLFVNDGLYILLDKGCTVLDLNSFTVLASVLY